DTRFDARVVGVVARHAAPGSRVRLRFVRVRREPRGRSDEDAGEDGDGDHDDAGIARDGEERVHLEPPGGVYPSGAPLVPAAGAGRVLRAKRAVRITAANASAVASPNHRPRGPTPSGKARTSPTGRPRNQ